MVAPGLQHLRGQGQATLRPVGEDHQVEGLPLSFQGDGRVEGVGRAAQLQRGRATAHAAQRLAGGVQVAVQGLGRVAVAQQGHTGMREARHLPA